MIYWLVRFVNNYRQYIIFTIFILLSLLLLSLNNSKDITTLRKASFIFYSIIDFVKSPFDEFFNYKKENEKLRNENAELTRQLLDLRKFVSERDELYDLIEFKRKNSISYITAKIILKLTDVSGNKYVIDKGMKDKVKLNAIVFNSKGLIGYISDLTNDYSLVHLISNFNQRISVKNERTNALGIMVWDGEKFKVYNVNKSADVKEGDVFVTSEYSSQFPSGIPVLRVTYVSKETDILFYDITGKEISEMDKINYCLILQPDEIKTKLNFLLNK